MTATKICHACKVEKPTSAFYKSSNSKDGLAPSCKDCQNGKTPVSDVVTKLRKPQKAILTTFPETEQQKRMTDLIYQKAQTSKQSNPPFTFAKHSPKTHTIVPAAEPEPDGDTLRAKDLAWWNDTARGKSYHGVPRAVEVVSVNRSTGTALVAYFTDPTCLRQTIQSLAKFDDLRRRHIT